MSTNFDSSLYITNHKQIKGSTTLLGENITILKLVKIVTRFRKVYMTLIHQVSMFYLCPVGLNQETQF